MIIGIDGNEANQNERVGVHQYALALLWGLYKLQDTENSDITFIVYLKNAPQSDLPPENSHWKYKIIYGGKVWILTKLMPALMITEKIDVFYSPSHYLPPFSRCPRVCMIHDLGYLKFSEQFKKYDFWQLKYWSAISIIISKYIICPSESTGRDIVRHYPFARKKIKVVPHGYDNSKFHPKISQKFVRRVTNKYRITKNYILYISTLKPSKNVEGLLDAYKLLKSDISKEGVELVIAGKKGWLYESIFQKVKTLGLEKDVIFTGYVSEDDKPALIKGAKVFVLPSYWEGFGMEAINSMACATPVVVSKVASLPEIVGNAGIYVDPGSPESIANGLQIILKMNEKEYNRQVELGLRQAQKFSWDKTARETLKVLENANNKG